MIRIKSPLAALAALLFLLAAPAQAADVGDLKLLPGDGDIVLQVDVRALMGTPLVTDLLKQAKMNPQTQQAFDKIKTEYGIDPEKDIERMTILFPAKSQSGQALMVVNTKGSYDQMVAAAKKEGDNLQEASHAGVKYHRSEGVAMARMGGRILVGDEALLKKALDTKGKVGLTGNKKMMGLVDRASKAGGQIWFAAVLPDEVKAKMAADNPEMKDISTIQGSLDLTQGLKLRLDIGANAGTAAKMTQAINTQLEQAKKEQANNPMMAAMGFAAVINGIKAAAVGDEVKVALDLTPAQVDQLKAMAMMMVGLAGAQQGAAPAQMPAPTPAAPAKVPARK